MASNPNKIAFLESAKEFALPDWVFRYRIGILVAAHAGIFSNSTPPIASSKYSLSSDGIVRQGRIEKWKSVKGGISKRGVV